MVTDNQVKEAIKTIVKYCSQRRACRLLDDKCAIYDICKETMKDGPEYWPDYMEEE